MICTDQFVFLAFNLTVKYVRDILDTWR